MVLNEFHKLKAGAKLLLNAKAFLNQDSYYPEEPHKSKWEIFCDQMSFVWKYGDTEKFYFAYGFDRKNMTRKKICHDYIINEAAFLKKIDFHNNHINKKQGRFSGRCIVSDKFYFYLFLKSLGFPTPCILFYTRKGSLLYYDDQSYNNGLIKDILTKDMDAFAKPYGGQLGNGAFTLKVNDSKVFVNDELISQTDKLLQTLASTDYIIQERVIQHPQMNKLCSTSLNTIRVQTIITEDENVIAFRAGVRMGREGSHVDNWAKGGVFVGIDMDTGKLLKTGFIKPPYGTTVTQHPDNGLVFEGFEIPFFNEAVKMAKALHSKLYRIHSVGWDIAITPDGPVFIEGNSLWEISLLQASMGGLKSIEKYFD